MIIPTFVILVIIWVFTEQYSFLMVKIALYNTNYTDLCYVCWVNNWGKPVIEIQLPFLLYASSFQAAKSPSGGVQLE